jgi:hypothetical protein
VQEHKKILKITSKCINVGGRDAGERWNFYGCILSDDEMDTLRLTGGQ